MSVQNRSAYRLTESAIMLAFAAVLSIIKIIDMPYGGSVTAFSMLPLLIIAYRYGTRWGLLTAFTYSLIQLLLGLDNFSYAPGFSSMLALAVFDYLLAFLVLGLGGLLRRRSWSQSTSLAVAAIVTGVLRYLCHTVSGFTVWRDLSVPFGQAVAYSLSYNATYMIPEIVILTLGAVYVSRLLSFDGSTVTRAAAAKTGTPAAFALSAAGKTALLAATVWIVVLVAPALQSAETGELFLAGLAGVSWSTVGIIAAAGILLCAVLETIAAHLRKR